MPRGVGIEITAGKIRAAVVDPSGKKLLAFHEEAIEASPAEQPGLGLATALKKIAQKVQGGRVVVGLDSGDVVVREITLPFKGEEQIRKTVAYELESLVHNYSIEDLVVDTIKVGETEKGTSLLATAAPRKILAEKLKELAAAGLDPAQIDLDMAALFNAYQHSGAVSQDEPFLIVYGTARHTKMLLVEGKRPCSLRTIRLAIPSRDTVETQRRERAKLLETGIGESPSPIVVLTEDEKAVVDAHDPAVSNELIEILAKEISRFLLASGSTVTPTHVLLCGDYDNDEAAAILATSLAIPVKVHDPLAAMEHSQAAGVSARIGVALGLALKGAEIDALRLDFRRGEFAFKGKFEGLKTAALVGLELAIVLLAVAGLHFFLTLRSWTNVHESILKNHADLYSMTIGREIAADKAYADLKRELIKARTGAGQGEHPIEKSALELWNQVFRGVDQFSQKFQARQLGEQKMYVMIETFDVKQTTTSGAESVQVTVRGVIQNEEYASALRQELKTVEPFKADRWELPEGNYTPTADGRKKFDIVLKQGKK